MSYSLPPPSSVEAEGVLKTPQSRLEALAPHQGQHPTYARRTMETATQACLAKQDVDQDPDQLLGAESVLVG